jgi:hypothetical protein
LGHSRARLILAIGIAALVSACGSTSPTASPSPVSAIILTSPQPQPPAGLADPSTPAYQASSGFTPDAVRVLTVLSTQLGLERYQSEHGVYPASLEALFPADAPLGQDGRPMTGPPSQADGYTYTGGGTMYTLSVTLASGQAYTVHPPVEP